MVHCSYFLVVILGLLSISSRKSVGEKASDNKVSLVHKDLKLGDPYILKCKLAIADKHASIVFHIDNVTYDFSHHSEDRTVFFLNRGRPVGRGDDGSEVFCEMQKFGLAGSPPRSNKAKLVVHEQPIMKKLWPNVTICAGKAAHLTFRVQSHPPLQSQQVRVLNATANVTVITHGKWSDVSITNLKPKESGWFEVEVKTLFYLVRSSKFRIDVEDDRTLGTGKNWLIAVIGILGVLLVIALCWIAVREYKYRRLLTAMENSASDRPSDQAKSSAQTRYGSHSTVLQSLLQFTQYRTSKFLSNTARAPTDGR